MLLADEFIIDLRDQIGAVFELCCFGEQVARHADKAVAIIHFHALIVVALQSVFRQRAFDEDMYARTAHRAFGKVSGNRASSFSAPVVLSTAWSMSIKVIPPVRQRQARVAIAQAIAFCRFKVRPRFGHIALCKLAVLRADNNFFAFAFFVCIGLVTRPIRHGAHFFGKLL